MTDTPTDDTIEAGNRSSAEKEGRFHSYESSVVPWFVRLLWLGFWTLAVWYVLSFLLPVLQSEISNPP